MNPEGGAGTGGESFVDPTKQKIGIASRIIQGVKERFTPKTKSAPIQPEMPALAYLKTEDVQKVIDKLEGNEDQQEKHSAEEPIEPVADTPASQSMPATSEQQEQEQVPIETEPQYAAFQQVYPEEYKSILAQSNGDRNVFSMLTGRWILQEQENNSDRLKLYKQKVFELHIKNLSSQSDEQIRDQDPFIDTEKSRKEKFVKITRKRLVVKALVALGLVAAGGIVAVASHGTLLPAVITAAGKAFGAGFLSTAAVGTGMDYQHIVKEGNPHLKAIAEFYTLRKIKIRNLAKNVERANTDGFYLGPNGETINSRQATLALYEYATKLKSPSDQLPEGDEVALENAQIEALKKKYLDSEKGYRVRRIAAVVLTGLLTSGAELASEAMGHTWIGEHDLLNDIHKIGFDMQATHGMGAELTNQIKEINHDFVDAATRHVHEVGNVAHVDSGVAFNLPSETHALVKEAVEKHSDMWGAYHDIPTHTPEGELTWAHDMGSEGAQSFYQEASSRAIEYAGEAAVTATGAFVLDALSEAAATSLDDSVNYEKMRVLGDANQKDNEVTATLAGEKINIEEEKRGIGREIMIRDGLVNIELEGGIIIYDRNNRFMLTAHENGGYFIQPLMKVGEGDLATWESAGSLFQMSEARFRQAFVFADQIGEDATQFPEEVALDKENARLNTEEFEKELDKVNIGSNLVRSTERMTFAFMSDEQRENYLQIEDVEGRKAMLRDLIREIWPTKLAVHAADSRYNPESKTREDTNYSDLDGEFSLAILKKAGVNYKRENVAFIPKGSDAYGRINLDAGNVHGALSRWGEKVGDLTEEEIRELEYDKTGYFDHHGPESGPESSTARIVFATFKELGMLEGVGSRYENFVDFVSHIDNKNVPNAYQNFDQWNKTLVGLASNYYVQSRNMGAIIDKFFASGHKPEDVLTDEELKEYGLLFETNNTDETGKKLTTVEIVGQKLADAKQTIEMMVDDKEGYALNSPKFGKVLIDIGSVLPMGFDTARAYGFDTLLVWNPDQKGFVLSTSKQIGADFDLPGGLKVRGHMILKPKDNGKEIETTLGLILRSILGREELRKVDKNSELGKYLLRESNIQTIGTMMNNFPEPKEDSGVLESLSNPENSALPPEGSATEMTPPEVDEMPPGFESPIEKIEMPTQTRLDEMLAQRVQKNVHYAPKIIYEIGDVLVDVSMQIEGGYSVYGIGNASEKYRGDKVGIEFLEGASAVFIETRTSARERYEEATRDAAEQLRGEIHWTPKAGIAETRWFKDTFPSVKQVITKDIDPLKLGSMAVTVIGEDEQPKTQQVDFRDIIDLFEPSVNLNSFRVKAIIDYFKQGDSMFELDVPAATAAETKSGGRDGEGGADLTAKEPEAQKTPEEKVGEITAELMALPELKMLKYDNTKFRSFDPESTEGKLILKLSKISKIGWFGVKTVPNDVPCKIKVISSRYDDAEKKTYLSAKILSLEPAARATEETKPSAELPTFLSGYEKQEDLAELDKNLEESHFYGYEPRVIYQDQEGNYYEILEKVAETFFILNKWDKNGQNQGVQNISRDQIAAVEWHKETSEHLKERWAKTKEHIAHSFKLGREFKCLDLNAIKDSNDPLYGVDELKLDADVTENGYVEVAAGQNKLTVPVSSIIQYFVPITNFVWGSAESANAEQWLRELPEQGRQADTQEPSATVEPQGNATSPEVGEIPAGFEGRVEKIEMPTQAQLDEILEQRKGKEVNYSPQIIIQIGEKYYSVGNKTYEGKYFVSEMASNDRYTDNHFEADIDFLNSGSAAFLETKPATKQRFDKMAKRIESQLKGEIHWTPISPDDSYFKQQFPNVKEMVTNDLLSDNLARRMTVTLVGDDGQKRSEAVDFYDASAQFLSSSGVSSPGIQAIIEHNEQGDSMFELTFPTKPAEAKATETAADSPKSVEVEPEEPSDVVGFEKTENSLTFRYRDGQTQEVVVGEDWDIESGVTVHVEAIEGLDTMADLDSPIKIVLRYPSGKIGRIGPADGLTPARQIAVMLYEPDEKDKDGQ